MSTPASETGKLILDGVTIVGPAAIAAFNAIFHHPDATPEARAAAKAGLDAELARYDADIAAAKDRIAARGGSRGQ